MAEEQQEESVDDVGGYMLTTWDNPFDPFTQWEEWYAFDEAAGYHTCALLARIVVTSEEHSDLDHRLALQDAIDEIVNENVSGKHRKVRAESMSARPT
jgi:hypothetical protein